MTTAGEMKLARIYFRCVKCGNSGYAADERLGIQGRCAAVGVFGGVELVVRHLVGSSGRTVRHLHWRQRDPRDRSTTRGRDERMAEFRSASLSRIS